MIQPIYVCMCPCSRELREKKEEKQIRKMRRKRHSHTIHGHIHNRPKRRIVSAHTTNGQKYHEIDSFLLEILLSYMQLFKSFRVFFLLFDRSSVRPFIHVRMYECTYAMCVYEVFHRLLFPCAGLSLSIITPPQ